MKRYFANHAHRAIARLTANVRAIEGVPEMTRALVQEVQVVGDLLLAFWTDMDLDEARGDQLDILGAKVRVYRYGLEDRDYRRLVKAGYILRRSNGSVDAILEMAVTLFDTEQIAYHGSYPHAYTLDIATGAGFSDTYKARAKALLVRASQQEVDVVLREFEAATLDEGLRFDTGTFDGAGFYRTI